MARVHHVAKSRKDHTCGLGHVIPKGSPYSHAAPGYHAPTRYRCIEHPFRPSDLASGMNAEPMAAQEAFDDGLGDLEKDDYDGLNALVTDFRQALEDYRDSRQESLDAWENGNSQLEELLNDAEEQVSNFDVEEFYEYDEDEPEVPDAEPEQEEGDERDAYDQAVEEHSTWEQAREDHWDECVNAASDASASVSL